MSLRFTALKLEEGDAFLLQDDENNRNYLFDSGGAQSTIEGLLKGCGVNKLDVAICSHNDQDHSNGFIGLLNSNTFTINEIWLPALWGSILCFIDENKDNSRVWSKIKASTHSYYNDNEDKWKDYDINKIYEEVTINANELKERLTSLIETLELSKNKTKGLCAFIKYLKKCKSAYIVRRLNNIIKIASLAIKKNCKIVWFQNTLFCVDIHCQYDFHSLNSKPICVINSVGGIQPYGFSMYTGAIERIKAKYFIHTTVLTAVNRFSLVFEFYNEAHPVVRFSADSDNDCQTQYPYKNNIIITAPHHGSEKNDNVYKTICGGDIFWIRTWHKCVKVGCAEFLKCNKRYCVKCQNQPSTQEVCFEYKNGVWAVQGMPQTCQG